MKKLFTLSAFILLTGFTSLFAQKLAHVNSQEVLTALPEVKAAEQFLISKQKEAETEMQGLQAEYQSKIAEFQQMQQNPNALPTLVENKYNEIMSLEKTMQEFGNNKQVELRGIAATTNDSNFREGEISHCRLWKSKWVYIYI